MERDDDRTKGPQVEQKGFNRKELAGQRQRSQPPAGPSRRQADVCQKRLYHRHNRYFTPEEVEAVVRHPHPEAHRHERVDVATGRQGNGLMLASPSSRVTSTGSPSRLQTQHDQQRDHQ